MAEKTKDVESPPAADTRRSFIAVLTGALATLAPLGAGLLSFFSPLLKKSKSPRVRIGLLSQVPDDGMPRYFPVIANREDAWNKYPQQRIGAIYLVRQAGEEVPTAFTAKCPHAGCFIGYTAGDSAFKCPCHTSSFNLDGTRARGDDEVSPRDMDTLPVELKEIELTSGETAQEIYVEFIDFQTGHKEPIPTA